MQYARVGECARRHLCCWRGEHAIAKGAASVCRLSYCSFNAARVCERCCCERAVDEDCVEFGLAARSTHTYIVYIYVSEYFGGDISIKPINVIKQMNNYLCEEKYIIYNRFECHSRHAGKYAAQMWKNIRSRLKSPANILLEDYMPE